MRTRIALAVLAVAIIALLIWRATSCEEKPITPAQIVPVKPPVDAAPPDVLPVVAVDAASAALAPAHTAPSAAAAGGERPHGREKGAQEEKVAQAAPAPRTPDARPAPPPPPDAAPLAKKPDAEALEQAPAMIERKKGTVVFHHHNGMGTSFHLLRIVYVLDGQPVFERTAPQGSSLDEPR